MKIAIFTILSLVTFFSCSDNFNSNRSMIVKVNAFSELKIEDWFTIKEYIPLITNNSEYAYLNRLVKVRFDGKKIGVLDVNGLERCLFLFDSSGIELAHRKGLKDGEKKFYTTTDFNFVKDNIFLPHTSKNEIIVFDNNLRVKSTIPVPENKGVKNIFVSSDSSIIFRPTNDEGKKLPSPLYFMNYRTPLDIEPISLDYQSPVYYPLEWFENFVPSQDGNVLYFDLFSSKIWKISGSEADLFYEISINDDIWINDNEIIKLAQEDLSVRNKYLNKIGKAYQIDFMHDFTDHFFLSFKKPGKRYFVLINKSNGDIKSGYLDIKSNQINSIDGSPSFNNLVGITNNGELVFSHSAELFKLYAKSTNNQIHIENKEALTYFKEVSKQITPNCSQVLAIVELKK